MKTILIPTDFSPNSENAVHFALEISRKLASKIVLFHSYVLPVVAGDIPEPMVSDDELRRAAEKTMIKLKDKILGENPGMGIETILTAGFAESEIVKTSSEIAADLVIMGTQGASGLKEVLIGSITASVMEETACPVLAVPENSSFKGLRKIVFATNYAHNDFENIERVIDIARSFNAEVILLHVSNGELDKAYEFDAIERFKSYISMDAKYDNISFKLLENRDVTDGLSLYLDEIKADLLAMSMQHRTFFQKIFNRSKTKHMAFHTHIPLLAFHAE